MAKYNSSIIDPVLKGFVNGKSLTAIVAAEIWHHRIYMREVYAKPPKEIDELSQKEKKEEIKYSNVFLLNL